MVCGSDLNKVYRFRFQGLRIWGLGFMTEGLWGVGLRV